jgi:hypothetical protein
VKLKRRVSDFGEDSILCKLHDDCPDSPFFQSPGSSIPSSPSSSHRSSRAKVSGCKAKQTFPTFHFLIVLLFFCVYWIEISKNFKRFFSNKKII